MRGTAPKHLGKGDWISAGRNTSQMAIAAVIALAIDVGSKELMPLLEEYGTAPAIILMGALAAAIDLGRKWLTDTRA